MKAHDSAKKRATPCLKGVTLIITLSAPGLARDEQSLRRSCYRIFIRRRFPASSATSRFRGQAGYRVAGNGVTIRRRICRSALAREDVGTNDTSKPVSRLFAGKRAPTFAQRQALTERCRFHICGAAALNASIQPDTTLGARLPAKTSVRPTHLCRFDAFLRGSALLRCSAPGLGRVLPPANLRSCCAHRVNTAGHHL